RPTSTPASRTRCDRSASTWSTRPPAVSARPPPPPSTTTPGAPTRRPWPGSSSTSAPGWSASRRPRRARRRRPRRCSGARLPTASWSCSATTSRRASTAWPPRPDMPDRDLADEIRAGNVRGLARAISLVEQRDPALRHLLEQLRDRARRPRVLGFTGAPGTGKSTLVEVLVGRLRKAERKVGVIAVDPNSPYSGGAILGDRIRMQRHALDAGVYIRSMGARGHLGGLSAATREAIRLLGAFGFDDVLLETVGVGQSEL